MPLKDNDPKKWEYKEHTRVKHKILEKYLKTWINILSNRYNKVCYFDCFAGRGRYTDEQEGSPIITLRVASELRRNRIHIGEIELTFIEKDINNYENLVQVVDEELRQNQNKYTGIKVKEPINDDFATVVPSLIQDYKKFPPSFFFIDPFGFKIPLKIIKDILSIPKTEVFINFMIRDVNRFLGNENHQNSLEELFGLENVEDVLKKKFSNLDRESAILRLYIEQLHEHTGVHFTFPYKVNADEKLQTTYYLIHATNNLKGCEVMKEIMYNTGTRGRFGYLGPAEGQMALVNFYDLSEFKNYIMEKFCEKTVSFENIRFETVNENPFLRRDYVEALRELEKEEKIWIEGKGKKGAIHDKSMINFKPNITGEIDQARVHCVQTIHKSKPNQASLMDF
jgi:three-Cys-motif partner protein